MSPESVREPEGPYIQMEDFAADNGNSTTPERSANTQTRSRRLNKWLTEPKVSVLDMSVVGLLGLMGWGMYGGQMAIRDGECNSKIDQARSNWESEPRTRVGGAGPHYLPSSTSAIVAAPTEMSDGSTRVAGAVPEGLYWTSSTASGEPTQIPAPTVTEPRKRRNRA